MLFSIYCGPYGPFSVTTGRPRPRRERSDLLRRTASDHGAVPWQTSRAHFHHRLFLCNISVALWGLLRVHAGSVRIMQPPMPPPVFTVNTVRHPNIPYLKSQLTKSFAELFKYSPVMPLMLRLAWHDAGTYRASDTTGGANATIRMPKELAHTCNAGLEEATKILIPLTEAFKEISVADMYQVAGIQAIKFCGGPNIPITFGRFDVEREEQVEEGRLPNRETKMPELRTIFHRMGLTDKDMIVLLGAHCMRWACDDTSGPEGIAPEGIELKFDNSYYKELLETSSDPLLLAEPELRAMVEKYAGDQHAFFVDYMDSHTKLTELNMFDEKRIW